MSLINKIKRTAKLAIVCAATYYVGRTCNRTVFGQETENYKQNEIHQIQETYTKNIGDQHQSKGNISTRDTIREMGYQTLR